MGFESKGPFRLVLNGLASAEIEWHCKHYCGRGLMKHFKHGNELAKEMNISPSALESTFKKYNQIADSGNDPFGKKFFKNGPFKMDDIFNVAIVTPVIHYCMGGIHVSPHGEVLREDGVPVPGLYCTGEVMGGTHGINRLGGSSLLDCVVFGRVAGQCRLLPHATCPPCATRCRAGTIGQRSWSLGWCHYHHLPR